MEKLRTVFSLIFSSVFSLIVIPFFSYLTDNGVNSVLAIIILLFGVSILSLVNYFIIPTCLYRVRVVRYLVEPLARYEGFWMHYIFPEDNKDKRVCGIISFYFDKQNFSYLFSGENYSANGELVSSFQVRNIQYDKNINGFRYWGAVKQYENAAFSCYGELSFSEMGEKLITSGNGMFINNSKELVRAKYITERLYGEKNDPYKMPKGLESIAGRSSYASKLYHERYERIKQ